MSFEEQEDILIKPYGGKLVNLLVPVKEREDMRVKAASLPRVQLSARNVCDLELLATGGFSPLSSFMNRADYDRVLEEMRLSSGVLFPLPITLTVNKDASIKLDSELALADQHNNVLAVMHVEEIFEWDREREARFAYGTDDLRHPLVAEMNSWGDVCISGQMRG